MLGIMRSSLCHVTALHHCIVLSHTHLVALHTLSTRGTPLPAGLVSVQAHRLTKKALMAAQKEGKYTSKCDPCHSIASPCPL